ncbi:MAG: hypothetical protein E7551_07785 [Ruminococcaceae bacterium]|nr:hypothetical protein [Oscillospiraceae bacterium]
MTGFRFPKECTTIIDVTKPPYNADPTGKIDCTASLRRAFNDIMQGYQDEFNKTKAKLEAMSDPNALITFEIRKVEGKMNVIFPEDLPIAKIIYFPNGTYLVSDTISYFIEDFRNILFGLPNLEMNCRIRILGESKENTVIKLKDNLSAFEYGNDRPVISFIQGYDTNIAHNNIIENLTINIGKGNPGATGVKFYANNTGAARNLRIISEDGKGNTGFSIINDMASACYGKNLEIEGFNFGIRVDTRAIAAFEHITLKKQNRYGAFVGNATVSFKDIKSENFVPALRANGTSGAVAVTDAEFLGGNPIDSAIYYRYGFIFLRNIKSQGYENIVNTNRSFTFEEPVKEYLSEYSSFGPRLLFNQENPCSLNLDVPNTPMVDWDAPQNWVCVDSFGAKGDGVTDSTDAIQKAMNSGKSTIYFGAGQYLINGVIEIPNTVKRVNFMYCDLASGKDICKMPNTGVFKVVGESESPLIMEDLFAFEKFFGLSTFVEHASKRTLILSDLHIQALSIYFNSVSDGIVFVENVGGTIGGVPGAGVRKEALSGEEKYIYDRNIPMFSFKNQRAYCRMINPEKSLHEVVNDGGILWVMGCKTEEEGTAFETKNGGFTEVIGAQLFIGLGMEYPAIINENSNVSAFVSTLGMTERQHWPIVVSETQNGVTRLLKKEDLPLCYNGSVMIPLYVGEKSKQ